MLWVFAINNYIQVSKIIEPKKEKLQNAELLVKQNLKQLDMKRKALQVYLKHLNFNFNLL